MLNESLAKRYSQALYASAKQKRQEAAQFKELRIIQNELEAYPQLRRSLISPVVPATAKKEIIKEVFAEMISQRSFNFLFVLIDNGREAFFDDIVECYKVQFCEENKIIEVTVESARELDLQMRIFVETHLNMITGQKIKMVPVVNPDLIGGLVIKYSGHLYDGSLRRHLNNVHNLMLPQHT